MRALPTPRRLWRSRTPSGPRPRAGRSPGSSVARVTHTCPTTAPSITATSDSGGSHAPLTRKASTSPGSTGSPSGYAEANASAWTSATARASPGSSRRTSTGTRSSSGQGTATGLTDLAHLRPQLRPRDAALARQPDRLALLVVVEADAVVDARRELDIAEPATQLGLLEPDHDQRAGVLGWWAP